MRTCRGVLVLMLGATVLWCGLDGLRAAQGRSFDKLSDEDRTAFAARFKKEVWPLLTRDGKVGCVGCHTRPAGGAALRLSGDADKDFLLMLRTGFLLKGDAGNMVERVADKDVKRRMPPKQPAWLEADIKVLRAFVNDLDAKQQK